MTMDRTFSKLAALGLLFFPISLVNGNSANAQVIDTETNGKLLKLEEAKYVSGDNCEGLKNAKITLVDDLYMKISFPPNEGGKNYLTATKTDVGPDQTYDTELVVCNIDLKFSSKKKIKMLFSNTVLWGKANLAPGHNLDLDLDMFYKNRIVGTSGLYYSARKKRQKPKWRPHTFGMTSKPRNFDRCLDNFTIRMSLYVAIGGDSKDERGSYVRIWEIGTEQEVSALDIKFTPDESSCK